MAKGLIERIELKISSENWNEVMIAEYVQGRRIEHNYYSVPKKVVMKLLNASKNPTISDFDGWVKEADDAAKKNRKDECVSCTEGCNWFGRD
jgi:5-formaminoimidazole-4-carboxamide-1-beta-D-ribofuranosyl 5'-monophosphate synthetase